MSKSKKKDEDSDRIKKVLIIVFSSLLVMSLITNIDEIGIFISDNWELVLIPLYFIWTIISHPWLWYTIFFLILIRAIHLIGDEWEDFKYKQTEQDNIIQSLKDGQSSIISWVNGLEKDIENLKKKKK